MIIHLIYKDKKIMRSLTTLHYVDNIGNISKSESIEYYSSNMYGVDYLNFKTKLFDFKRKHYK